MSSIAAAIQDICVLKLADHIDACSNLDVRVYTAMQWQKKVSAYTVYCLLYKAIVFIISLASEFTMI